LGIKKEIPTKPRKTEIQAMQKLIKGKNAILKVVTRAKIIEILSEGKIKAA